VSPAAVIGIAALFGVGLAISLWVFWPAFEGADAARAAIGTHRLALGAWATVIFLNALITVPLAPYLRFDQGLDVGKFLVAALASDLPMLTVVYVRLIMPGALKWSDLGLRPMPLDSVLRIGLAAGLAGLIVIEIVGSMLAQLGLRPNQLEQFQFVLTEGPVAFGMLLLVAAVVAPFIEELFFRGFLFGLYRRRQPLWVAYASSGVLFTVLHLEPQRMNAQQMAGLSVGILMLAIMLAWLYQRTGSLYPGIVAHAVNNATGLILFYALGVQ
jgi:membrane protease YdiL (CAAX protease family)